MWRVFVSEKVLNHFPSSSLFAWNIHRLLSYRMRKIWVEMRMKKRNTNISLQSQWKYRSHPFDFGYIWHTLVFHTQCTLYIYQVDWGLWPMFFFCTLRLIHHEKDTIYKTATSFCKEYPIHVIKYSITSHNGITAFSVEYVSKEFKFEFECAMVSAPCTVKMKNK